MKLIFGLGNPGRKYLFTRHNIGSRVVDLFAQHMAVPLKKSLSSLSLSGHGRFKGMPFILAKPLVFMNENGKSLKLLVEKFSPDFKDILLIYDDIDLPIGTIRFRTKGGPGTHNGMKSCIEMLGDSDFPRMRVGIRGERRDRDLAEYVLEDFREEEEMILKEVFPQAIDKILTEFLSRKFLT